MTDELKEAYKMVYEDLLKYPLFTGIYNAKNGSFNYMSGVMAVMEYIASMVSDETQEMFNRTFCHNISESQRKAGKDIN